MTVIVRLIPTKNSFLYKFLAAEEKKEEVAAPPVEDTGDVDDLVCIFGFLNVILKQMLYITQYFSVCVSNNLRGPLRTVITSLVLHLIFSLPVQLDMM